MDLAEFLADTGPRIGFGALQFDMNLFRPAPEVRAVAAKHNLLPVARQPLAMGLLAGRTSPVTDPSDLRLNTPDWLAWYKDGEAAPVYAAKLASVRELLQSGGRTLAQGAMGGSGRRTPVLCRSPAFAHPRRHRKTPPHRRLAHFRQMWWPKLMGS